MAAHPSGRAAAVYGASVLPLRDENPIDRVPLVTLLLIVACGAVFLFAQRPSSTETIRLGDDVLEVPNDLAFAWRYAVVPCEIVEGRPLLTSEIERTIIGGDSSACERDDATSSIGSPAFAPGKPVLLALVSSLFLHGGIAHLGLNLWFLWIFGNNIEDRLGHLAFGLFYLAGGIAATVGHIAAQPSSTVPVVGASGAIAAVMGAYLVWFPNAPIRTVVFLVLVDVRARWFLIAWFVVQFFTGPDAGVAWIAHVVGFVYGAVLGLAVRRTTWDRTGGAGHGPYPHPTDYVPGIAHDAERWR